jgi:hypothetical protein
MKPARRGLFLLRIGIAGPPLKRSQGLPTHGRRLPFEEQ